MFWSLSAEEEEPCTGTSGSDWMMAREHHHTMIWALGLLSLEGAEEGDIWAECGHSQLFSSEPIRSRVRAFVLWLMLPSLAVGNQ